MPVSLPTPIAAYFAADRTERAGVADCFTEAGIVKDEGKIYAGREAIRRWKTLASTQYAYVSEPFAIELGAGRAIVTSRVTGNFPGSPVDLRYSFVLEAGKIASLEIGL
jgi:hypothetical protein